MSPVNQNFFHVNLLLCTCIVIKQFVYNYMVPHRKVCTYSECVSLTCMYALELHLQCEYDVA